TDSAVEAPAMDIERICAFVFIAILAVVALEFLALLGPGDGLPAPALPLAALGIALGLVLALAMLAATAPSMNPDEFSHADAARYYMDRWLPPAVGDPASITSYSSYGASYLNELDVVYLVVAKFAACIAFTGLDDVVRLRLFNVALLALCGVVAMRSRVARIVMLPLLCSPQVWYVFGYFNGDA